MLEQRIQQQFFESADLQYECAETLARQAADAASCLLGALTAGGKLLLFGAASAAPLAQHLHRLLISRFERERPPLAAVLLHADPSMATAELLALALPGDVLLLLDDPASAPGSDSAAQTLACIDAAHQREAAVLLLGKAMPAGNPDPLHDTDVRVALPQARPARVLEAQLLVLHALCDALDMQLLGEQESS